MVFLISTQPQKNPVRKVHFHEFYIYQNASYLKMDQIQKISCILYIFKFSVLELVRPIF
jgi:hypothetical protein